MASVYDYIVLTDFDLRERPIGETPKLVYKGLIKGGFQEQDIEMVSEPSKVVDFLFSKAKAGDLLVIQPDKLEPVMGQILGRYRIIRSSCLQKVIYDLLVADDHIWLATNDLTGNTFLSVWSYKSSY